MTALQRVSSIHMSTHRAPQCLCVHFRITIETAIEISRRSPPGHDRRHFILEKDTRCVSPVKTSAWLLGGDGEGNRVAMAFATGVRNFGVSLVIATASFPGTEAVEVALAYGLFQTIVLALLAAAWGQWAIRFKKATEAR